MQNNCYRHLGDSLVRVRKVKSENNEFEEFGQDRRRFLSFGRLPRNFERFSRGR